MQCILWLCPDCVVVDGVRLSGLQPVGHEQAHSQTAAPCNHQSCACVFHRMRACMPFLSGTPQSLDDSDLKLTSPRLQPLIMHTGHGSIDIICKEASLLP